MAPVFKTALCIFAPLSIFVLKKYIFKYVVSPALACPVLGLLTVDRTIHLNASQYCTHLEWNI